MSWPSASAPAGFVGAQVSLLGPLPHLSSLELRFSLSILFFHHFVLTAQEFKEHSAKAKNSSLFSFLNITVMVIFVGLTQPIVTWEERLSAELSILLVCGCVCTELS